MSSLSFSLYYPLILFVLAYAVLTVAGRILAPRRQEMASNLQTLGFAALLVAAAYTVVLLVMSLIDYPVRLSDLAVIFATIFVFFGVVLGSLFVLTEVRVGGRAVGTYVGTVLAVLLVVFVVLQAI